MMTEKTAQLRADTKSSDKNVQTQTLLDSDFKKTHVKLATEF
jgi:hypothetical protein